MIKSGAMLISARRCGSILLQLGDRRTNNWGAVPANAGKTFEDILFDVELKLDDLKAARSPVESEIAFVIQWLSSAREVEVIKTEPVKEEAAKEEEPNVVKISSRR